MATRIVARPNSAARSDPLLHDRGRLKDDHGVSLLGLIVALAIVGALAAAIPLLTTGSGGPSGNTDNPAVTLLPGGHPTSGKVAAAGSDISAAEVTACRTTYEAVETAVGAYQAETGRPPTSVSQLKTFIRDPLSSPSFTITIDPRRPGQVQVATRGHPAADGEGNCTALGS
jgi:hypothetical protein